jgi:hypothetical protein
MVSVLSQSLEEEKMDKENVLTIRPEIKKGFEGYAKNGNDLRFYGYVPIENTFCITYNMKHPETDKGASFSISFSNKDAIYIEHVLKVEEKTRRPVSDTYRSGPIFMTCFVGSNPVISNSEKKYSFSFAKNDDYDIFTSMLSEYFEKPDALSKEEIKLREDLKKQRE